MDVEASHEPKSCDDGEDEDDLPLSAILPLQISCLRKCSNETVKKSKVEDNVVDDEEDDDILISRFMKKRKLADKSFSMIKMRKFVEEHLALVENSIEECHKKGMVEENRLQSLKRDIDNCSKELARKEEELRVVSFKIAECSRELRIKEKELDAMKELVAGQEKKLESMKKQFEEQVKELEYRDKKLEGEMEEYKSKKKVFEGLVKEFESKEREFQGQKEELETEKMCFENQVKELEFEKMCLESRVKEFKSKEKQLDDRMKEFESKKREFEKRVTDPKSNEQQLQGNQLSPTIEENSLQLVLDPSEPTDEIESFGNYILDNLLATSDPSKVVLEIIQNPIVPQCSKGHNTVTINGDHIALLMQLMRISPHIKPHVREEAMKLALDLKAHMSENSQEVLGFLLILSIYGLVTSFNKDEVLKLFGFAAQHKIAVELFETLGFADKVSDFVQNLIRGAAHRSC